MFHNEINCLTQTINFIMEHYGTASTINCIVHNDLKGLPEITKTQLLPLAWVVLL